MVAATMTTVEHHLLRLSTRVVLPLTIRWNPNARESVYEEDVDRMSQPGSELHRQQLLTVLRGVLRGHINPSGGLNVSSNSTTSTIGTGSKNGGAWYYVNAGDNLRFYYKFIEGQSFVLFNKRSKTETEGRDEKKEEDTEEGRYSSCRVVGYELIVLMTDDCEPRDFNSPDRGPINVISRYFSKFLLISA